MRMLRTSTMIAAVAATALLSITGPAKADPPAGVTPAAADIVGTGSDTIEYPLDQFSHDYNAQSPAPARKLYSWDATPNTPVCANPPVQTSSCILTKTGATLITRPDGSSNGILALQNQSSATVDFARSSRPRNTTKDGAFGANPGVVFVGMGDDAVTVATQPGFTFVAPDTKFTTSLLKTIYSSNAPCTYHPYLPQAGSGTRAFFLSAIGNPTLGNCVNQNIQENDGTALPNDNLALVPYSVSKYIAQADHSAPLVNGTCTPGGSYNLYGCDKHGTAVLQSIDGIAPTTGTHPSRLINSTFFNSAYGRTVFDVVRYDASTSDKIPAYLEGIFGSNGYICNNPQVLRNYGLLDDSFVCGATS